MIRIYPASGVVNNVGIVETKYFTFAYPPEYFEFECGDRIGPVTLAYETYGRLNTNKSNAILVTHALSGDAHAAGFNKGDENPGWWDNMIGPGKALDTDKYFVICSNVLGGCKGSTGPSSINPLTNKPYGIDFPRTTIRDMVNAQLHLIEYLGVNKLFSVIGGSMGGMQVLAWMVYHPGKISSAVPIATALNHSPQQIAFNEVGRQAIMSDPNWNNGNYYGGALPGNGLSLARMVGHITYISDASMTEKFGRKFRDTGKDFKFTSDFEVAGYLHNRGNNFIKRFDANSYLYVTRAIDYFDPTAGKKLGEVFKKNGLKVLVISFKSDWLYPSYQSQEIVRAGKLAGIDVHIVRWIRPTGMMLSYSRPKKKLT